MTRTAVLLALLTLAVPLLLYAADETATLEHQLPGQPAVIVTLHADGAAQVTTDTSSHGLFGKRAFFFSMDTDGDGTDENLLVRIQEAPNGLYVDIVADTSVANVDSRMANVDLSGLLPSHPSPTEDTADSAAITAAGS